MSLYTQMSLKKILLTLTAWDDYFSRSLLAIYFIVCIGGKNKTLPKLDSRQWNACNLNLPYIEVYMYNLNLLNHNLVPCWKSKPQRVTNFSILSALSSVEKRVKLLNCLEIVIKNFNDIPAAFIFYWDGTGALNYLLFLKWVESIYSFFSPILFLDFKYSLYLPVRNDLNAFFYFILFNEPKPRHQAVRMIMIISKNTWWVDPKYI